jgi:hypothetical protein
MNKFIPQNFNDFFALVLIFLIVGLWIIQGLGLIALRDDVNGGLTVLFALVVQYYFRKSPPTPADTTTSTTTTIKSAPPVDTK